jgi:hypothetical protein
VHGSNQSHVVAQHVQSRVVEELFVDVKRNEHGHRFQLEDLFVFCNLYFFAPPGSEIMFALLVIEKTKSVPGAGVVGYIVRLGIFETMLQSTLEN